MNRKDMKLGQKKRDSTTDLRKKEKENRKLQLDLNQEKEKFNHMAIKYQKELSEMQAVSLINRMLTARQHATVCVNKCLFTVWLNKTNSEINFIKVIIIASDRKFFS